MRVFGICNDHHQVKKLGFFQSPKELHAWMEENPHTTSAMDLILTEIGLLDLANACISAFTENDEIQVECDCTDEDKYVEAAKYDG